MKNLPLKAPTPWALQVEVFSSERGHDLALDVFGLADDSFAVGAASCEGPLAGAVSAEG